MEQVPLLGQQSTSGSLNCCTLLGGLESLAAYAREDCGTPSHNDKDTQAVPAFFLARRADRRPITSSVAVSQANSMASWPSCCPTSPPRCTAAAQNDFINILPGDQYLYWSTIVRVIRLNPEQPRAQRWEERKWGCREYGEIERVCSHSERERRYKGREGNLRADAELSRWGCGFRTMVPGHWDWGENYGNCFLIKGGRLWVTNEYCFKHAGDLWRNSAKKCVCVQDLGSFQHLRVLMPVRVWPVRYIVASAWLCTTAWGCKDCVGRKDERDGRLACPTNLWTALSATNYVNIFPVCLLWRETTGMSKIFCLPWWWDWTQKAGKYWVQLQQ